MKTRREFITEGVKNIGLVAALGYAGVNEFLRMGDRIHEDKVKELYRIGDKYQTMAFTEYTYRTFNQKTQKPKENTTKKIGNGMGIVKDHKYYTCNHIINPPYISARTPFGIQRVPINITEFETTINDIPLENIVADKDTDIAVFDLPEYYEHPEIPYDFNEAKVGDKVYVVGNPMLRGGNVREGRVGDIDGFQGEKHSFGHSAPLINGDSGTYILNDKFEVVGLNSRVYGGVLSYGIKIQEFDRLYQEAKKQEEEQKHTR